MRAKACRDQNEASQHGRCTQPHLMIVGRDEPVQCISKVPLLGTTHNGFHTKLPTTMNEKDNFIRLFLLILLWHMFVSFSSCSRDAAQVRSLHALVPRLRVGFWGIYKQYGTPKYHW